MFLAGVTWPAAGKDVFQQPAGPTGCRLLQQRCRSAAVPPGDRRGRQKFHREGVKKKKNLLKIFLTALHSSVCGCGSGSLKDQHICFPLKN